LSVTQNYK